MFEKAGLQEWETLVKKQLKTDNYLEILQKENLEGLEVRPYYHQEVKPLVTLPKIEENTNLVSEYHEEWEQDAFAFLLHQNVEGLEDKVLFIDNKALAEHIIPDDANRYLSLVDVFTSETGELDANLAKELLEKGFERSIGVDVSFFQNAGASIAQQLGIALAKTKDLVEKFDSSILDSLVTKIAIGPNYFFEIAKIRACKLVFNQLSQELGKDQLAYIFAETSLRNKAIDDEENNLIRSTLELAAGMIGGADAVFANNFKMKNPTKLSDEISFKQQIVLAYESIINVFEDAGNGSYYVEDLTQQIAQKAWDYFLELEALGGFSEAMKVGKIQNDVFKQATEEQKWVSDGKIKLIGVNLYPTKDITKNIGQLYSKDKIQAVRWAEAYE